jgi:hypothetical protein
MTPEKLASLPIGTRVQFFREGRRDHLDEGCVKFDHPDYPGRKYIAWDDGTSLSIGAHALRYVRQLK